MKAYESVHTYLPFAYFLVVGVVFATTYHLLLSPIVVVALFAVNTVAFRYNAHLARSALHMQIWKTATLATYGTCANLLHEALFAGLLLDSWAAHVALSLVYIAFVAVARASDDVGTLLYVNIAFLFVPGRAGWVVNQYAYLAYVTAAIVIAFSKCRADTLTSDAVPWQIVLSYFVYLRAAPAVCWLGAAQLAMEYRHRFVPDEAAAGEVERMIEEAARDALRDIPL